MSEALDRALLLFRQSSYAHAERELRLALAADANDGFARALLALCLAQRKELDEATREAKSAVADRPTLAFAHYALACVLEDRGHFEAALQSLGEAIRLDPEDASFHALRSGILLQQRDWNGALAAAEQGLQIDAEHQNCANLRAMALLKLGRKAAALDTIEGALARNPEDALAHANQGWALLEQSRPREALEHFREALRINPEMEWARSGIVEALKARYFLYRWMLRYFLWMGKLSYKAQWAFIIGFVLARRALSRAKESHPAWAPVITFLLVASGIFLLLTWIADPLFNLLLRFNRFGRLALSAEQTRASNVLGVLLALLVIGLLVGFVADDARPLVFGAGAGTLMLPAVAIFRCPTGWPRQVMTIFTIALALLGVVTAFALLNQAPYAGTLIGAYLIGILLSTWIGNSLALVRVRK